MARISFRTPWRSEHRSEAARFAEIEVVGVKVAPVRWRKKVALGDRAREVGTEAQHRFAIAPFLDEYGVAGGDEQRLPIASDPALRPCPAAPPLEKFTALVGSLWETPRTIP